MELVLSYTFFFLCILLLGTIAGIFSERVGIVNIAINGFMVFGTLMYIAISVVFQKLIGNQGGSEWNQIWITLFAGGLTSLFALLFGFATIKLKSEQTISGFAINLLSAGVAALLILVLLKFQNAGTVLTFNGRSELALGPSTSWKNIISFKLLVTIIITVASWYALRKTKWGLRFRAIGENPQAADVAGVNVNKTKWQGILISGFIAGISGALYAQTNIASFSITKDVQGLGYIALSIMITGRWKVTLSVLVSFFFSLLLAISFYGVSLFPADFVKYKDLFNILPYALTLILMLVSSKNSYGPAAAGIPYDKSQR
ncbi:ABC transporter permease [Mycoplasmopsis gallopavonis]|uniref:ABC-type uncharacterized transport system, permease component n=1 Tax=Mycoplasmopsis gallopavonis TaxID=76629 RepID=A0A449AYZ1_9BACT|nr:ABC transporter permease [Mycoplasmopsis gallopavonis]RIV16641.1 ABC transporter permease [Mycoplasmopsis gallopavonis]VEU72697.1 ABC-type uncharacterized transport system, permease component [Mycoplasmopsis gallopavonis]